MSRHLAIDIGASGGKAFVGEFNGDAFTLTEVNRFPNGPVEIEGLQQWDVGALIEGIRESMRAASGFFENGIDSLGIDTWGVDFGFIDGCGDIIGNPFAYREPLVSSTVDEVRRIIPPDELFGRTGIQHLPFNTIFQLHSLFKNQPVLREHAHKMLLMPGLLAYLAGGLRPSTRQSHRQLSLSTSGQANGPLISQNASVYRHIYSPTSSPPGQ